ncbi:hypothetical protein RHECNPAF_2530088 [Rhizobium etli CNPAF512]|nr:hypothetical protein RHECNPAF_2530088 [Rhizobium etli CNPAF512]
MLIDCVNMLLVALATRIFAIRTSASTTHAAFRSERGMRSASLSLR